TFCSTSISRCEASSSASSASRFRLRNIPAVRCVHSRILLITKLRLSSFQPLVFSLHPTHASGPPWDRRPLPFVQGYNSPLGSHPKSSGKQSPESSDR